MQLRRHPKKIILVDDHGIVREGIKSLFGQASGFEVGGEATGMADTLGILDRYSPDIIITEIHLADSDGFALTREIKKRFPDIPVLVLSMHDAGNQLAAVWESGAAGYLHKSCTKDELIRVLHRIMNGEQQVTLPVVSSPGRTNNLLKPPNALLTGKEMEILRMVAAGFSSRAISEKTGRSEQTISKHRYNMMKKLNAKNSAELIKIGRANGLLPADDEG